MLKMKNLYRQKETKILNKNIEDIYIDFLDLVRFFYHNHYFVRNNSNIETNSKNILVSLMGLYKAECHGVKTHVDIKNILKDQINNIDEINNIGHIGLVLWLIGLENNYENTTELNEKIKHVLQTQNTESENLIDKSLLLIGLIKYKVLALSGIKIYDTIINDIANVIREAIKTNECSIEERGFAYYALGLLAKIKRDGEILNFVKENSKVLLRDQIREIENIRIGNTSKPICIKQITTIPFLLKFIGKVNSINIDKYLLNDNDIENKKFTVNDFDLFEMGWFLYYNSDKISESAKNKNYFDHVTGMNIFTLN